VSDAQGLLFASLAEDYDRGRGGWPSEIYAGIEANTVLDLAAGTGKLTALLAARYREVVAVEPLATMRKILRQRVPKASALAGTAEAIPLDDESVDAVFVAEAFHWFDSAAAAQEIQRVLRPNGWLVISFNEPRGGFEPGLSDEAQAILEDAWDSEELPPAGLPKVLSGAWRRGLATFEPLSQIDLDHEWRTDTVGVASYYVSVSSMGALAEETRVELRRRLVELTPAATHRWRLTAHVYRGRRA
jgi:SAM-dependent methyltransferase